MLALWRIVLEISSRRAFAYSEKAMQIVQVYALQMLTLKSLRHVPMNLGDVFARLWLLYFIVCQVLLVTSLSFHLMPASHLSV